MKKRINLISQAASMAGKFLRIAVPQETKKLRVSEYKTFITKTSQLGCTISFPLAT